MTSLLVLQAACAVAPPSPPSVTPVRVEALEPADLSCLAEASQVGVAYYEAPKGAAACSSKGYDAIGPAFGLLGAVVTMTAAATCMNQKGGIYVDVAPRLRDRFVEISTAGGDFGERQVLKQCPAADDLASLHAAFGERPVIDFKTVTWKQTGSGRPGDLVFNFPETTRARLVDTKSGKVLWEEVCNVPADDLVRVFRDKSGSGPDSIQRFQVVLGHAADQCAVQFTERLKLTIRQRQLLPSARAPVQPAG
jgi:hypothetical protein